MDEMLSQLGSKDKSFRIFPGALTVEQVAQRISVSPRTVRRLIFERRVRHLRIGRLIRLYEPDVDEFLAKAIVEPVA